MRAAPRLEGGYALASLQWACITLGLLLCGAYGFAVIAGETGRSADLTAFETFLGPPDQSL